MSKNKSVQENTARPLEDHELEIVNGGLPTTSPAYHNVNFDQLNPAIAIPRTLFNECGFPPCS
jgi:hypothetical protein